MDIEKKLEELGINAEHLDAIVEGASQAQVSRINNEGVSAQLMFLKQQGFTVTEVLKIAMQEAE